MNLDYYFILFITDGFTFNRKEEMISSQNPEQNQKKSAQDTYPLFLE